MANINLCLILNTSHALIKANILARWGMRYYFYVTLMQRISISVRHEWLILIISDPKICMSSISEHYFFASSQIIIHGNSFQANQVANFPVFSSFFIFFLLELCTSITTTIWRRRRVTVAFCLVVHAASATTHLITRRITRTLQRPTRSGRRRRRRSPSSTLRRRRPILTATTHPSPVSK